MITAESSRGCMRARQAHQRSRFVEAVAGAGATVNGALRFCFEPLHHVQQVPTVSAALAPLKGNYGSHTKPPMHRRSRTYHIAQSALASTAEALPPPAVSEPRDSRQTLHRGSGRLQFGQAIGRVEGAEADEEAAHPCEKNTLYKHLNYQIAEKKCCQVTTKGRAVTLNAASKP